MLKNIVGYIYRTVCLLFRGIEICENDIKCCIFVILYIKYGFFLFDKIRIVIYKKQNNHDTQYLIVCKYGILMTFLWLIK